MKLADRHHGEFASGKPFPHVVIDGFLPEDVAEQVRSEFAQAEEHWKYYNHFNEKKLALTDMVDMPTNTRILFEDLQSAPFLEFVMALTGIDDLLSDPHLEGAGMHMIRRGGFLNIHTDFLTHTKNRHWSRQVNLLLYLNPDWQEEWQGNLELWPSDMSACAHSIPPVFNRCVVFQTRSDSLHGHPHRLNCPSDQARKSLAIYYYRDEGVPGVLAPTGYRPRPGDGPLKRALIAADRNLLALYTFVKGRTSLSDKMLSRFLKRF